MSLQGKHLFGSIGDTRVTFVEKKVDENRKKLFRNLIKTQWF